MARYPDTDDGMYPMSGVVEGQRDLRASGSIPGTARRASTEYDRHEAAMKRTVDDGMNEMALQTGRFMDLNSNLFDIVLRVCGSDPKAGPVLDTGRIYPEQINLLDRVILTYDTLRQQCDRLESAINRLNATLGGTF